MTRKEILIHRANEYAQHYQLALCEELGFGVHGIVFATERHPKIGDSPLRSALKIHEGETPYRRERDIYLRLKERGVIEVRGCEVPRLIRFDDRLLAIEMSMVSRPFILDFAGAYLDYFPDFPEEAIADWRAEKAEQFGERWPEVQAILRELETYGIYMEDVSPSNIGFLE